MNDKKAFTLNLPIKEAESLEKEAKKTGVSVTLFIRLWIRQDLMKAPITIIKK